MGNLGIKEGKAVRNGILNSKKNLPPGVYGMNLPGLIPQQVCTNELPTELVHLLKLRNASFLLENMLSSLYGEMTRSGLNARTLWTSPIAGKLLNEFQPLLESQGGVRMYLCGRVQVITLHNHKQNRSREISRYYYWLEFADLLAATEYIPEEVLIPPTTSLHFATAKRTQDPVVGMDGEIQYAAKRLKEMSAGN